MARTPDTGLSWSHRSVPRNALTNKYEPLQPYFLSEFLKSAGCRMFVDVGANIGFYSVFFAFESSVDRIVAFEPMPAAAEEMRTNIKLNGFQDLIDLRQVAISDVQGNATIGVISDLSGANAILETSIHEVSLERTETVRKSTLDHELPIVGERLAIKIDVEGHELEVLKGATQLLSRNQVVVQLENYSRLDSSTDPGKFLFDLGYKELIKVGPDQYFTNKDNQFDSHASIQRALARFTEASKEPVPKNERPIRFRIFKGVNVELSSRASKAIRRLIRSKDQDVS